MITRDHIRVLRRHAAAYPDPEMVAICDVALGERPAFDQWNQFTAWRRCNDAIEWQRFLNVQAGHSGHPVDCTVCRSGAPDESPEGA